MQGKSSVQKPKIVKSRVIACSGNYVIAFRETDSISTALASTNLVYVPWNLEVL
jgi:hypothetical protein